MYTLKVLSSEDFDKLPYKHAKRSLGLANAKTGVAFVRDTGYNDVTKATISHELDEMVNKVSPHEEDGIRYKSLASMGAGAGAGALSNIIGGMLPGKLGTFIKGASPVISAGAGALANRKGQPLKGALQGFTGGGLGSAVSGGAGSALQALGSDTPGGAFGKAISGFGSGAMNNANQYISEIPGMGGFSGVPGNVGKGTKFLNAGGSGFLGNMFKTPQAAQTLMQSGGIIGSQGGDPTQENIGGGLGGNMNFSTPDFNTTGGALQTDAKQGSAISRIFDQVKEGIGEQLGNLALPLGVSALGGFGPEAQAPDYGPIVDDLSMRLDKGTELGGASRQALMDRLMGPTGGVPENAFTSGDLENAEAKNAAMAQYTNQFKSIRPGADFANDPEFLRGWTELENKYDRVRTAQRDATTFEYNKLQAQQRYQDISLALGMDQNQMQTAMQIAQLEVNQMALQYGVDTATAAAFKKLFGDMGQMLMQSTQPQYSLDMKGIMDAFSKQQEVK